MKRASISNELSRPQAMAGASAVQANQRRSSRNKRTPAEIGISRKSRADDGTFSVHNLERIGPRRTATVTVHVSKDGGGQPLPYHFDK
jgi:hypothetical protein